ncbi:uncharacterized protein [Ptychodera flava]|uniref:uncharacterized protein n=1 Tax=Ptychodera flava TaxID=63121 RepID=UPI00396A3619
MTKTTTTLSALEEVIEISSDSEQCTDSGDNTSYVDDHAPQLYNNDQDLPIIIEGKTSGISTGKAVSLLLQPGNEHNIARTIPDCVNRNVAFVCDTKHMASWKDILCDGNGSWETKGTKTFFYKHNISSNKLEQVDDSYFGKRDVFKVKRRQYVNKSSPDFHRVVIRLMKSDGVENNLTFVQYFFDGPEHNIVVKKHGNSKEGKPYYRTSESTKSKIKLLSASSKAKAVVHQVIEDAGGVMNIKSVGQFPRNRKQVTNFRHVTKRQEFLDKDSVVELIEMAKNDELDKKQAYIRSVKVSPELMVVLTTDQQLSDIEKFVRNQIIFVC